MAALAASFCAPTSDVLAGRRQGGQGTGRRRGGRAVTCGDHDAAIVASQDMTYHR
jgi:hypothetical protein